MSRSHLIVIRSECPKWSMRSPAGSKDRDEAVLFPSLTVDVATILLNASA